MGHPPRLMGTALACLFLIFAAVDASGKCTTGCHGIHPKGYQEGHTYVYQLTGKTVTSVSQAHEEANLDLSATVELSVKPDCMHQLWLKDVLINNERTQLPGLDSAIQFNYHNGHIDTELCASPDDPQASLNIKRAVISLFQSAVLQDSGTATHHETDVLGVCPTSFSFNKKGDILSVEKTRNLEQCSFRENSNQGLISTTVDTAAGLKTSPLLASSQTIKQRFKQSVLESATSTEVHKLRPFSNGESGAKTVVETTLVLKSEKPDNPTAPVTLPKSLIFEVPHPVVKYQSKDIANAVKAAQEEIAGGVKPEAASKFADLVKVLRQSSSKDILSIYQKVKAGAGFDKASQQVFLDGLFHAGNGEAVEIGVKLLKNKELTDVQTLFFYTSLALIRHAQLPTVQAVTTLLDQPDLPRIGYLGIGQVIGKYCQDHPCENVPEVKEAVHKIREKVGNGKAKTREQENTVVSALKSLGNTRFLDDATLTKLANIASDKTVKNRVRVAALETLPTRCSMKWKNIAFKLLADKEQDSEIRIKTYLALVACPCEHVAGQLKEILDKETVNQVGSFIQTHLRNLRASTDPGKTNAKMYLGQIKPRTKFPEDVRKFSYNDELSYKIDSLGLGSTVEENVIYSQDSFVPRSANLNVTIQLFGRNLNLLDLSARVENLDRVIEHWFGPKGELWNHDLEDVKKEVKDAKETASSIGNYAKKKLDQLVRGKRAAVDQHELDRFAKKVHLRSNEIDQNLDLDVSLKLFGVELAYLSWQDESVGGKHPENAIIDKIFEKLQKAFDAAKNLHYDAENYVQFLEAELVYPTNLGTSLSLGLTGTSAVRVHTHTNVDVAKILQEPKNAAVKIALEPSVSVRIAGNIVVEALGTEAGMKVVSTLHTATSTDLTVNVLNGKGVDVQFSIPKKKQEVINVNSEVLVGNKGKYKPANFGKTNDFRDCFGQLAPALGLTVCGEVSFPYTDVATVQQKALFPLSGPAKFAVTVENVDANSYHFKVHLNDEEPGKRSFEILFETPGSKTKREISLTGEIGTQPDLHADLRLTSPIKNIQVGAALKNNEKERTLTVQLVHENVKYYGRVGIEVNGNKYKPVLDYNIPEHIEKLAGVNVAGKSGKKYSVQGTVDVAEDGKKYTTDKIALLMDDQEIVSISGSAGWQPNLLNIDAKIGYAGGKQLALTVSAAGVLGTSYSLEVVAKPSSDPNLAFELFWELLNVEGSLDHKLTFVHGPDFKSETNRFSLKQNAVYKLKPNNLHLSTHNELKYPAVNLKVKLNGRLTQKSVDAEAEFKYEKFNVGGKLSSTVDKEKPGDYELELEAELLKNKIELKTKSAVVDPSTRTYVTSLEISPGGKYDSDVKLTWNMNKGDAVVGLNALLKWQPDANLNGKPITVTVNLDANKQLLNALASVKVNGAKQIEGTIKSTTTPHPTGHLNLFIKNYLTATGQYSYKAGNGQANLDVDIPTINRKIQATGHAVINQPEYSGTLEILYDAKKDPNKRVKLTTNNHITKTAVDSKNVIEAFEKKLEVNGKHSLQGDWNNGVLEQNLDITLPDGQNINGKLNGKMVKKDNVKDFVVDSELAYSQKKGGPSTKLLLKDNGKFVSGKEPEIQRSVALKLVDTEGKDMGAVLNVGKKGQDSKMKESLDLEVSGAKIPKTVKLTGQYDKDEQGRQIDVEGSWGDDWKVSNSLKHKLGDNVDKAEVVNEVFKLKSPCEKLKNLGLDVKITALNAILGNKHLETSSTVTLTYNSDNTISTRTYFLSEKEDLTGKIEYKDSLNVNIGQHPPLSLEGSLKYAPTEEAKTADVELKFEHADKKVTFTSNNVYKPELATVSVNVKSALPIEKFKDVDLQLDYKRYKPENKLVTDAVLNADGKKYTLNSVIQSQEALSLLNIVATCPNEKFEVLSKYQKTGPNEYKGEWNVHTPNGFVVTDVQLDLDSADDFMITANFDSDKTKYRKVHAEITNKPTAKAAKRIIITVTSDGQNVVTGSTSYKKREEEGKTVIEGKGTLKVGDNTKSSSFKYTRQQLTNEKDGEVGVAVILNANFGTSAIVGELKLSNKELHAFNSYCEQTKDCAHFKLLSTLDAPQDKSKLKHQLTVEVDLKKFNVPAEFGLKTNTQYNYPQLDHSSSLYLHSTKEKSEYTYQLYIHPKESASILTLPTREVALIVQHDLPKTKQTGAYKLDVSLYLDKKNKPSDKTSLTANGDINIDKNSLSLSGDAKFSYPTQTKDLSVKGRLHCGSEKLLDANLDLDVFDKKSQKITITANVQRQPVSDGYNITSNIDVNSRGQQLKLNEKSTFVLTTGDIELSSSFSYNDIHQKTKTLEFHFSADKNHALLLIALPDKILLKDDWTFQLSKESQSLNGELTILGEPTEVLKIEGKGLNSFELTNFRKDNPNNKLTLNGQLVLGQLAEIHADTYKDGAKKNLFSILLHLDEKQFLKPDISYDKANVNEVLIESNNFRLNLLKKLKETQEEVVKEVTVETGDLFKHLEKALPTLKPLAEYYKKELNKLKEEINADETVKEIQATFNKYFGGVVAVIVEILKDLSELAQKLEAHLLVMLSSLKEVANSVYPKLKESYDKIYQSCLEIIGSITKLVTAELNLYLDLLNAHKTELQDLLSLVSGVAQDFLKALSKVLEQVKHDAEQFTSQLTSQLKALPVYEIVKEKFKELKNFKIPDAVLATLEEFCSVVRSILPIPELQQLSQTLCKYLTQIIVHEKIVPSEALKEIVTSSQAAIRAVLAPLKGIAADSAIGSIKLQSPIDWSLLFTIPSTPSLQLSVLNLLRNQELPSLWDIYLAYRPTLHPSDVIPPFSKSGVITDGGHIFTFDGRHLTLPGSCSYILAQDIEDGNFSVVASLNKGTLNSITITAPEESITIKSNGNILVNNKRADYPANTENLHGYLVLPFTNVKSDYGVRISCTHKAPLVCAVHVSGFYHGKLRGLLGDGNNEPHDDFTLPSGTISESGTDFGNAYKLKGDCPAATAVDHKDRAPICTDYFIGQNSALKSCFKYVNPSPYREACDHAVAADPSNGPCLIAMAYHYSCYAAGILTTHIPPPCTNCKVGANPVGIGDTFSVKIPKKEADVVIVVEQLAPNEKVFKELITPFIPQLREELKSQGITDVHVGLIGFADKLKTPQHYTLNGDTNINGDVVKNVKFYEKTPALTFEEAAQAATDKKTSLDNVLLPLKYLKQKLDIELGTLKLTDAYTEAINYPFRPGAAKVVIGVHATVCKKSPLPISLQQVRLLLGQKTYRDLGLTYYHISYPDELIVSGKPQKNIVGYDENSVYTFADSDSKKPLVGRPDLKNNLVVPTADVCADFAVSSGGALFSLDNFVDAKPNQKKQFVQVAAKRVADGLANLELEQDCLCEYQFGLVGRAKCKIVGRKDKSPTKDTKAGVKG